MQSFNDTFIVCQIDLKVLWGIAVSHVNSLIQTVEQDYLTEGVPRLAGDLCRRQPGELILHRTDNRVCGGLVC